MSGRKDHPTRIGIVEALAWIGEPCSPVLLAPCLGEKDARVNYHLNVLVGRGVLVEVSTHPQRGALERRYVLAAGR